MTIQQKAQQLSKELEWQKRDNKDIVVNKEFNEELNNLSLKISDATALSMDSTYRFMLEALELIVDADQSIKYDELQELADSIEGDIYTSDLTEWLNEDNRHIYYLTDALQEYGDIKDGFQLLAEAQSRAKREVYQVVLSHLLNITTK